MINEIDHPELATGLEHFGSTAAFALMLEEPKRWLLMYHEVASLTIPPVNLMAFPEPGIPFFMEWFWSYQAAWITLRNIFLQSENQLVLTNTTLEAMKNELQKWCTSTIRVEDMPAHIAGIARWRLYLERSWMFTQVRHWTKLNVWPYTFATDAYYGPLARKTMEIGFNMSMPLNDALDWLEIPMPHEFPKYVLSPQVWTADYKYDQRYSCFPTIQDGVRPEVASFPPKQPTCGTWNDLDPRLLSRHGCTFVEWFKTAEQAPLIGVHSREIEDLSQQLYSLGTVAAPPLNEFQPEGAVPQLDISNVSDSTTVIAGTSQGASVTDNASESMEVDTEEVATISDDPVDLVAKYLAKYDSELTPISRKPLRGKKIDIPLTVEPETELG
jgi:hypothetical protein